MTDNLNEVLPSFTAEEKAYFDNRGVPAETEQKADDTEIIDVVEDGDEAVTDETDDAVEDGDEPENKEKPRKQVVPLTALHRERDNRKAAEDRARNFEVELAKSTERMQILLQSMQPPQEPEDTGEDDPIGFFHRETQSLKQQVEEFKQQQRVQQENAQLANFTQYHEAEFIKSNPDYYDAVNHLRSVRVNELNMLGYAPEIVQRVIMDETDAIIRSAAQASKSPAEIAYSIAKQRGYAPKAAKADAPPAQSTKSLSQGGGTPPGAGVTAQDILRMSPDEFSKFSEKNPKKLRQLMGG